MRTARATVICDMQFGSTGKGLIAGYLAERDQPDVVMTAWSMNAGHTYINADGRKFIHCMLANGVVSPKLRTILIGPGSQIGIAKLIEEAKACKDLLEGVRILIHPNACVIQQHHIDEENISMTGIGSTKKGCGAALVEKIHRRTDQLITAEKFAIGIAVLARDAGVNIKVCTHEYYMEVVWNAERIQVEGAQGYSLGINSGFYPYVTSRECTPAQIASDVLLPLPMIETVVGTMRTFPIRVANRFDDQGNQIGWSGPCYEDQTEVSFEALGQETELTTVTKLPRRIFTFSEDQCRLAMGQIQPDEVFLNFTNYAEEDELKRICTTIHECARAFGCGSTRYIGTGPTVMDVQDLLGVWEP